ncbi:MAG: hypothetical protein KatS3mg102_0131 [Planctomycetota bacterium]|nr:MAG: hypothetical protein KatS3mg102_0131 [Planctomycetota bacterium]
MVSPAPEHGARGAGAARSGSPAALAASGGEQRMESTERGPETAMNEQGTARAGERSPRRHRLVPLVLALAAAAIAGGGCASGRATLRIEAAAQTNDGRPLYMVLRAVDGAEFVTETYEDIAARVFAAPPDPSIIRADVVYPGMVRAIAFDPPERKPIGVYFLFTEPGDRWKTMLQQPLPSTVEIRLGPNTIIGTSP